MSVVTLVYIFIFYINMAVIGRIFLQFSNAVVSNKRPLPSVQKIMMLINTWVLSRIFAVYCDILYPLTIVGGHIVFSGDPVGVGVASCLHSISLMDGWILARLTQFYHWVGEKKLIRFWWP